MCAICLYNHVQFVKHFTKLYYIRHAYTEIQAMTIHLNIHNGISIHIIPR